MLRCELRVNVTDSPGSRVAQIHCYRQAAELIGVLAKISGDSIAITAPMSVAIGSALMFIGTNAELKLRTSSISLQHQGLRKGAGHSDCVKAGARKIRSS
jgi:hypothetical protein